MLEVAEPSLFRFIASRDLRLSGALAIAVIDDEVAVDADDMAVWL